MIRNLLVVAFEGGSNYWYRGLGIRTIPTGFEKADFKEGGKAQPKDEYGHQDYFHWAELIPTFPGGSVDFFDRVEEEDGKQVKHVLDLKKLRSGLRLLRQKYPKVFYRIVDGQDDSSDADIFLQLAIFGEVLYG